MDILRWLPDGRTCIQPGDHCGPFLHFIAQAFVCLKEASTETVYPFNYSKFTNQINYLSIEYVIRKSF